MLYELIESVIKVTTALRVNPVSVTLYERTTESHGVFPDQ